MKTPGGFFVTGTDTGVGKTVVCAALVAALRAQGHNAIPTKAVQTGSDDGRSRDLDFCLRATACSVDPEVYELLSPYRFTLAASPDLAARRAGARIELSRAVQAHVELRRRGLVTVAEGAGGLMVPLNEKATMLDLMVDLALPVVLVARPTLGTLNHTLLSAAALRARGLHLAAVVLNEVSPGWGMIEDDNLATLGRWLQNVPVLRFPHLDTLDSRALADAGGPLVRAITRP